MESMLSLIKKIDHFLEQNILLTAFLLLAAVLRIPNFFEPYWYGDEAIYLTIGTAMRNGERLYADIIDHKTPIIYYLAMVPSQMDFRVLNVVCALVTITLFYFFAKQLMQSRIAIGISMLVFVLLTTLPWFEGMIPNGELFVMFFIFWGATCFAKTTVWKKYLQKDSLPNTVIKINAQQSFLLFLTGCFFSLGVLTKVPALFDALAFFFVFWLLFVGSLLGQKNWHAVGQIILAGVITFAGLFTPILVSIIYFVWRGSGQAYLNYGLLYNFHYVETWVPHFSTSILNLLFTLPGKAVILAVLLLLFSFVPKVLSNRFRFLAAWFGLALFATLLSNRPYPHYYLQTMPPLALLVGYVWEKLGIIFSKSNLSALLESSLAILLVALFGGVLMALQVGPYSTKEYYLKFWQLATQQISATQYRNSFNGLDADNYKAAAIIKTSKQPKTFIWGTDPMLYALSGKSPVGRFTVAFHIFDLHAENETLQNVISYAPEYIVVLKQERHFPELEAFITQDYSPNVQFEHFTLWKHN